MADSSMGLHEAQGGPPRGPSTGTGPRLADGGAGGDRLVRPARRRHRRRRAGATILAHNRDEEKEHAAMTLEWLRRHDPSWTSTCARTCSPRARSWRSRRRPSRRRRRGRRRRRSRRRQPRHRQSSAAARSSDEPPATASSRRSPTRPGSEIEDEATPRAARTSSPRARLVDFAGPLGWEHSALGLGRVEPVATGAGRRGRAPIRAACSPWWSCARPFTRRAGRARRRRPRRPRRRLGRGRRRRPPRRARRGPPGVPAGTPAPSVQGMVAGLARTPRSRSATTTTSYPNHVAQAVDTLRRAGVDGPTRSPSGRAATPGVIEIDRARRLPGARAPAPDRRRARWCGRRPSTAPWW